MDYESLLKTIKKKTDMKIARLDPSDIYHESYDARNGRYTDRKRNIMEMEEWTRSFFTGMVALVYHHYKEEDYLKYLEKSFIPYKKRMDHLVEKIHDIHHDAGFMYLLYSSAYNAVSPNQKAFDMTLKVADEFSKRFRFKANVIQGFGAIDYGNPQIIIDDMMNIALLMWAYNKTGHCFYKKIFRRHIDTVVNVMVRDDYTVRQAYYFDEHTGKPAGEYNYCGYAPGSTWSRGQSWMVYGLVNAIITMKDEEPNVVKGYQSVLNGLLNKYICLLPQDGIPEWDLFCVPLDDEKRLKDTSAAAILAAAIYKLDSNFDLNRFNGIAKKAVKFADKIMETIVDEYLADPDCENVIEGGQCGNENMGCVWGDYFFTEALMRKVYGKKCPEFWI